MVGVVDPASGVDVLQPGAAHIGVLLDDGEVDARLFEADAGENAGHAGAHDHHLHLPGRRRKLGARPIGRLGADAAGQAQLVGEKRGVVGRDIDARDPVDHRSDRLRRRRRRHRRAGKMGLNGDLGARADVGLDFFRIATQGVVAEGDIERSALGREQAGVAGEMDQGHQQSRQVRRRQGVVEDLGRLGHRASMAQLSGDEAPAPRAWPPGLRRSGRAPRWARWRSACRPSPHGRRRRG